MHPDPCIGILAFKKKAPSWEPRVASNQCDIWGQERPVGCERRFGTRARVIPRMLALTSILSLRTHQPFFAGPWEAYRLEYANPADRFVGVHPGRNTEAKSVCQKRFQHSRLLVPNHFSCSISKKRLVEAIVTSSARSTTERNTPDWSENVQQIYTCEMGLGASNHNIRQALLHTCCTCKEKGPTNPWLWDDWPVLSCLLHQPHLHPINWKRCTGFGSLGPFCLDNHKEIVDKVCTVKAQILTLKAQTQTLSADFLKLTRPAAKSHDPILKELNWERPSVSPEKGCQITTINMNKRRTTCHIIPTWWSVFSKFGTTLF